MAVTLDHDVVPRLAATPVPGPLSGGQRVNLRVCRETGRPLAVNAVLLPGVDGAELAARLAAEVRRAPVLAARLSHDRWLPARAPCVLSEDIPLTSDDERAVEVWRRVLARPIDPARGPLVRVVILRYRDGVEQVAVSAHAAALDLAAVHRLGQALAGVPGAPGVPPAAALGEAVGPCGMPMEWARFGDDRLTGGIGEVSAEVSGAAATEVIVAAVALVLSRYTRSSAPVVGVARACGEPGAELPSALAVELAEHATMATAWQAVRSLRTADAAEPPSSAEPHAWLPTVVIGQAVPPIVLDEVAGVQASPIEVAPSGGRLVCRYRRDLVDPVAAAAFVEAVAAAVLAGPAEPVGAVEIVRDPEPPPRRLPVDETATIHGLVEAQAAARPDAIAVGCAGHRLTYGELVAAAGAVAGELGSLGVGPGDRVGVAAERSTDLIVALLGVLTAGAAYVPLDPTYPERRLRFIVEDAGLAALVAGPGADQGLAGLPTVRLPVKAGRPPRQAAPAAADDDAYIIYTSGSTGTPKGVAISHRNVLSLLAATAEYGFGADDVWTMFHSYAFDFSVWEIWACLMTGGRVEVVPRDVARDPHRFRALLRAEKVTVLNQTPSAFANLLAAEAGHDDRLDVRLVVFGGEPLDTRMLLPWFDRYPDEACRVVNMYGITETTVHCTWLTVRRAEALAGTRSVGTAIPGWSLRVLDEGGRRLPVGVPGEICVAGAGVARGYIGRPALTASRFPAGLGTGRTGGRIYRSGDRGRFLPGGDLEHLGRLDDQVKIRGHRIEPGEIRAALMADPTVLAAAVVVAARGGQDFLDAYVVGSDADPAAIHARLAAELPDYQMPSTITVVGELPMTVNGKLDRTRLPAPHTPAAGRAAGTEPTGAAGLEAWLGEVWEHQLGYPVGADDNLFLVGGNSLVAVRILTEVRQAGYAAIEVADVYRHPTVRQLAARLPAIAAHRPTT